MSTSFTSVPALTHLEHFQVEGLVAPGGAALKVINQKLDYLSPSDQSPVLSKVGSENGPDGCAPEKLTSLV